MPSDRPYDVPAEPAGRYTLAKSAIRILLLEGVHVSAVERLRAAGYDNLQTLPGALDEGALIEQVADAHMLGIRSVTQVSERVLAAARRLFCIGCFCIGTNQVDLVRAKRAGIPVFNAPYSNTRSVAELVLAEIVMLFRGAYEKSVLAHSGIWRKSAAGSHEVRGKVLGIVGYGHIGSQLSVLAEAMGMQVRFFDIEKKMAIGNARETASLDELLAMSDAVTLHVPETPVTRDMIDRRALNAMRPGSFLINASRGNVVDIDALTDALRRGHLAGAAIDVFPHEPAGRDDRFESPLQGLNNVILTPHIGGSTQEAQYNIGLEVAEKLIRYSDNGSTVGAVNLPEVSLPVNQGRVRFLHIHANVPGVLRRLTDVFAERHLSIAAQYLQTDSELGYVVIDTVGEVDRTELLADLRGIEGTIRTRSLF